MKKLNYILLFIMILVFCQYNYSYGIDEYGVRARGFGNAYVAISDDGSAVFWNPSGQVLTERHVLTAGYGRPYIGITSSGIKDGYVSYIRYVDKINSSFGLYMGMISAGLYKQINSGFSAAWMTKFNNVPFSVGTNLKLLYVGYNENKFDDIVDGLPFDIVNPTDDPLFAENGFSKYKFGVDIGLMVQPHPRTKVGLSLRNINAPNLSLAGVDEGVYPLEATVGVSYDFGKHILSTIDLVYTDEEISDNSQFDVRGGLEGWLWNESFGIRAGANLYEMDAGLSWRTGALFGGLEISYAFTYPLSELTEVNGFSHRFDITIRGREPYVPQVDMEAGDIRILGIPEKEEKIEVEGLVVNTGRKPVKGFSLTLAWYDTVEAKWQKIFPTKYIEHLEPEQPERVVWSWKPSKLGNMKLMFNVDDDGALLPKLNGKIQEENEKNNSLIYLVNVQVPLKINIEPEIDLLNVEKVTIQKEEEPIVPVVFFGKQSDEVDDDYLPLLDLIAERLIENPNITLGIKGFYERESDKIKEDELGKRLAELRAENVYNTMVSRYPRVTEQVYTVSTDDYDCAAQRVKKIDAYSKFNDKVDEENRRAELVTNLSGDWDGKVMEIEYKDDSLLMNGDFKIPSKTLIFAKNNDELTVMVKGYYTGQEGILKGYEKAQKVFKKLFDNYPALQEEAKFVVEKSEQVKGVDIYAETEGLIYRPKMSAVYVKEYLSLSDNENSFNISTENMDRVDGYEISIVDSNGNVFRKLTDGKHTLPEVVEWDWKDEFGRLMVPDEKYYCQVTIERDGWKKGFLSTPVEASVTSERRQIENLILVEYIFDETKGASVFLESRIMDLAQRLITIAGEAKSIEMIIEGHTDNIGTTKRNQELSEARATKELENLKMAIMLLKGFTEKSELNSWLKDNDIKLGYEGFADKQPLVIDTEGDQKNLGDNDKPQGRTINRRVETRIDIIQ
ncbi:conjugal transfer protein TraF [bacterium]|nr:conjugal transfer protein TraF [bacterium]